MEKNLGLMDKTLRIMTAAIVVILTLSETIPDSLNVILLLPAGILLLTGTAGFCPLYLPFGLNSRRPKEKNN